MFSLFLIPYSVLYLAGTFTRLFLYIYQLYFDQSKVLNKKLIVPLYREYFVFHLLTAWTCVTFVLPYLLYIGDYYMFNHVNIFVWVTSLGVPLLGLDQLSEVFGKAIGTFAIVRNVTEIIIHWIVMYKFYGVFRAYHFILFGMWFHRMIDTYPRYTLYKYPFFTFPIVISTYFMSLYIGYTQTLV
jgi:hypothetical protein